MPGVDALLGRIAERSKRPSDAIPHYRDAIERDPDDRRSLRRLAQLLAGPGSEEAIALARRACELGSFSHGGELAVLALALGEAGHYDEAVEKARRALELARIEGDLKLVDRIAWQLRDYRQHRPAGVARLRRQLRRGALID